MTIKERWIAQVSGLQEKICKALELADGKAVFSEDLWERAGGGGGRTRILVNGKIIEKGGVNTSVVFGEVTSGMRDHLKIEGSRWFASGISIVIHPFNPFIPTIHCNYRMFELYNEDDKLLDRWFGGGSDLTPYYLFEEDARHFHQTYKDVCDSYDASIYPLFKKNCDDYFVNSHRENERRGIGGIFYDYQRADDKKNVEFWLSFSKDCGEAFIPAFLHILESRKDIQFTSQQKKWQEIRRGRYVEFNLVHDRGTLFGLKTHGRTESILMSLPPTVRFEYDHDPAKGSEEEKLLAVCRNPVNWV